jgi:hypothetical protein
MGAMTLFSGLAQRCDTSLRYFFNFDLTKKSNTNMYSTFLTDMAYIKILEIRYACVLNLRPVFFSFTDETRHIRTEFYLNIRV